ncbi:MAG TPA: PHP domain-containing protein [Kofleriaceae bacterium]|nr:PHP domain-containing protein [Kofleriaceae bacterium]
MRFELHCHSNCSDGTETPDAVAARAIARNVEIFALTDHDTCAGTVATRTGQSATIRTLRAVEISCDDPFTGRTLHVLAYDRGHAGWADLELKLADLREARRNRMRVMAAKLAQRGIRIDVEPLIADAEASGRTLGRPDLARLMIAHGAVSSMKEAFSRHLYDGGPVDAPHRALTLADALALGRSANAAMSLAHPHLYDHLGVRLLREFAKEGLVGVEAYYAAYAPAERNRWLDLAKELGLVATAGSDFHSPDDAVAPVGVDVPDDHGKRLRDWLLDA